MMSSQLDNLAFQLEQYGFSQEESTVFLFLLQKQAETPLEISRKLKIARTKVYRILDKLISKGLVQEEKRDYGKKFSANEPSVFLKLLHEKEKELLLLKSNTPTIVQQLNSLIPSTAKESKIIHYKGEEGLKQILWNSTKAKGKLRIYEYGQSMNNIISEGYSERIREKFVENKELEKCLQITNFSEIHPFTSIKKHLDQWECRFIDKNDLAINVEVQIYNDVYCMYEIFENEIFGVEIYNESLADFQKQVFDLIWKNARKMKITEEGGAKLISE